MKFDCENVEYYCFMDIITLIMTTVSVVLLNITSLLIQYRGFLINVLRQTSIDSCLKGALFKWMKSSVKKEEMQCN